MMNTPYTFLFAVSHPDNNAPTEDLPPDHYNGNAYTPPGQSWIYPDIKLVPRIEGSRHLYIKIAALAQPNPIHYPWLPWPGDQPTLIFTRSDEDGGPALPQDLHWNGASLQIPSPWKENVGQLPVDDSPVWLALVGLRLPYPPTVSYIARWPWPPA